jgi:hypothetical protein
MNVRASPRNMLRFLFGVILALSAINLLLLVSKYAFGHGNLFGLARLFDIDRGSAPHALARIGGRLRIPVRR